MRKQDEYYSSLPKKEKEWLDEHTEYVDQDYVSHNSNLLYMSEGSLETIHAVSDVMHTDLLSDMTLGKEEWKIIKNNCNLSDREKTCLYMRFWLNKGIVFIGRKLNIDHTTVRDYINRSKRKIAKFLK